MGNFLETYYDPPSFEKLMRHFSYDTTCTYTKRITTTTDGGI